MEKKFLINFSALNASAFINKIFSFIFIVVLMRLVTPVDFGAYNLIWAHVGILASWQDLGTTAVGMLQANKSNSKSLHSLLVLRLLLAFLVSIGTIVLALLFKYPPVMLLIIICFTAVSFSNAMSGFFLIITSIKEQLTITSVFSMSFNALLVILSISTLVVSKSIYAMLVVTTALYGLYGFFLLLITHRFYFPLSLTWDTNEAKKLIKRSFMFSLIAFFASIPSRSDFLLLARLGGEESLAVYAAAFNFFEASLMLASSYNIASLPALTKYFGENTQKFYKKIYSDFLFLALISIAVVLVTLLIGGPIIYLFFSLKYRVAVPILNILIFSLPPILITSLFLNSLYAMGKEKYVVLFFLFQAMLHITVNILFIPRYGYYAPTVVMVVGETIQTLLVGCYLFYCIRHVPHHS